MKHFIVEVTYRVPAEEIGETLQVHRAYLQQGYDAGLLLCSGPQNPWTGGMVVARAESREIIEAFFEKDPYRPLNLADYRIVEFTPVLHQAFLKDWVG